MPANRRKTIEYAFPARITQLRTNTTLATAERHETPSVTLFIPETGSRRFLSVRLVATYRTEYGKRPTDKDSNWIIGWRMGIALGAAAPRSNDRSFAKLNVTPQEANLSDVVDLDVTDDFNANFGSGTAQTCAVSLAIATLVPVTVNSLTFKLIITYEFDATSQARRLKTVRIPIQSPLGALVTTQSEIGADGLGAAPPQQIPALDALLPELGKVYRQIFLELAINDGATDGTPKVSVTPFLQIDTTSEVARGEFPTPFNTSIIWRDVYDVTGQIDTSVAHRLRLRANVADRLVCASCILTVTYEYDAATSSSIMCEAMIPLTMSNDDTFGEALGESFSVQEADAQALIAAFHVPEVNPRIVQSAAVLMCVAYSNQSTIFVRAGGQVYRPYVPGGPGGKIQCDVPMIHRVDHGGGWSLVRGDNRLVLNVYSSATLRSNVSGYALINYLAAAPEDPDLATHAVNYFATSYSASLSPLVDVPASGGGLRVPVLGRPYRLQGVMVEQYHHMSEQHLNNQFFVAQLPGEWDGAGFITTPLRRPGNHQVGCWRATWPLTKAFNADHLHTGKLDIEAARRQVALNTFAVDDEGHVSWSWWITYHQQSYVVAGTVMVAGALATAGKVVEIYARDARNTTEYVTATTVNDAGRFSVAVVDSTRTYFASYQDGERVGRSRDGTPGSSTFDITIGVAARELTAPPASASDLRGKILPDGTLELTWFHPDDLAIQRTVFDVYQSDDPSDLFRSASAVGVAALGVRLDTTGLTGERAFTVVARRGAAMALPSRILHISVPAPAIAPGPATTGALPARSTTPTGVGFPFGIAPTGGIVAQGGDALLRGKILQLLLTSPGERVNRPEYGTRLLDLVFDPNSDVLAATTEFTITRALQQAFADEIQLDSVQITSDDATLLVDISYLRKSDLTLDQMRIGVPLPQGVSP